MKFKDIIIKESPQIIDFPRVLDTNFLIDEDKNRCKIKELYENEYITLEETSEYLLIKFILENDFVCYILIDIKTNLIKYYNKCKINNHEIFGEITIQTFLWKDKEYNITNGIATKIVFNYILKEYDTLITDITQSMDGSNFWKNNILPKSSLDKKYYIGCFKANDIYNTISILRDSDYISWIKDKQHNWGVEYETQLILFFISKRLYQIDDEFAV